MSCFIVSNAHLSALIGWACRNNLKAGYHQGTYGYRPGLEQEAVNLIDAANVASFNARYSEATPVGLSLYEVNHPQLEPIEVIKACDCVIYQCDEWEGFEGSQAQQLLEDIQGAAIRKLPGYDRASWSLE